MAKQVCNLDCFNCPYPDCIRPEEQVYRFPSWDPANRSKEYRRRQAERGKERREERKAQGLCIDCGRDAVSGRAHCEACQERRREYRKKGKEKRRQTYTSSNDLVAQGLCRIHGCGQPHEPGVTFCTAHREMYRGYFLKAAATRSAQRAERRKERKE